MEALPNQPALTTDRIRVVRPNPANPRGAGSAIATSVGLAAAGRGSEVVMGVLVMGGSPHSERVVIALPGHQ
jgi:hypothetical protein